jgi:hypothetical protein
MWRASVAVRLRVAVGTAFLDQDCGARLQGVRGTQITAVSPTAAEAPFHRCPGAIRHSRSGRCAAGSGAPFTCCMVQEYRQQKADADQHSAYYRTSLHDCPPLGTKQTVTPVSAGSATRE